ncbi:unnamed protein product [Spirodela intermedia]|uniref:Uncharacterized protein n=1 Tax=Spirodela intermedia TaxID=51605 RepID=A0A7I8J087_SPIIN|nr:unnamed protein product [Spirodela intermedia]CAA6663644.1 unnamed protein product [Spirodela intermedia]
MTLCCVAAGGRSHLFQYVFDLRSGDRSGF